MNIQDDSGYTPLHTACRYGQLDIMKFLVSLPSVNVNIKDKDGYSPLHTACRYVMLISKIMMATLHYIQLVNSVIQTL